MDGRGRSAVLGVLPPSMHPLPLLLWGVPGLAEAQLSEKPFGYRVNSWRLPYISYQQKCVHPSVSSLTSHLQSFSEPPVSEVMEISLILTLKADPRPLALVPLGSVLGPRSQPLWFWEKDHFTPSWEDWQLWPPCHCCHWAQWAGTSIRDRRSHSHQCWSVLTNVLPRAQHCADLAKRRWEQLHRELID